MFQLGPSCMRRVLSGLAWALVSELGPFSSEVGPPGMKLVLSDPTRICPAKPDKSLKNAGEFGPLPKNSGPNPRSFQFLVGVPWAPRKFAFLLEEILATTPF